VEIIKKALRILIWLPFLPVIWPSIIIWWAFTDEDGNPNPICAPFIAVTLFVWWGFAFVLLLK